MVVGEFGVRVFDEWEWVECKLGVTVYGIEGRWFILDEIMICCESDLSIEGSVESIAERLKFCSGLLLVSDEGVKGLFLFEVSRWMKVTKFFFQRMYLIFALYFSSSKKSSQ